MEALHRQIEVALVVEELHDALDVIDSGVGARQAVLEQMLQADLSESGEGGSDEFFKPTEVAYRKEVLGQLVYRALFIVTWSSLEQLLQGFCNDLRNDLNLSIAESDLNGRGVERAMKYLRKVAGLGVDLNEWGWPLVKRYGQLRNHFVHVGANAEAGGDPTKARAQFRELPELRIEPIGEIVLTSAFVRGSIRAMEHLLIGVGKAVQDRAAQKASD